MSNLPAKARPVPALVRLERELFLAFIRASSKGQLPQHLERLRRLERMIRERAK